MADVELNAGGSERDVGHVVLAEIGRIGDAGDDVFVFGELWVGRVPADGAGGECAGAVDGGVGEVENEMGVLRDDGGELRGAGVVGNELGQGGGRVLAVVLPVGERVAGELEDAGGVGVVDHRLVGCG